MAETKKKEPTGLREASNLIQRAWQGGKKTVTIDGVLLTIERKDRQVTFATHTVGEKPGSTGTQHRRTESWLIARPKDRKKIVPVFNVEMIPGKNTRSTMREQQEDEK